MSLWGHSHTKLPQTSNLFKKHHLNHIHIYLLVFLNSVIFLFPIPPPVLGIAPRTSYILGKYLITRLLAQLQRRDFNIWFCELFLLETRWESNCMLFHANIFVCLRNQIYRKDYSSPPLNCLTSVDRLSAVSVFVTELSVLLCSDLSRAHSFLLLEQCSSIL